jgi:hypothetical protein
MEENAFHEPMELHEFHDVWMLLVERLGVRGRIAR